MCLQPGYVHCPGLCTKLVVTTQLFKTKTVVSQDQERDFKNWTLRHLEIEKYCRKDHLKNDFEIGAVNFHVFHCLESLILLLILLLHDIYLNCLYFLFLKLVFWRCSCTWAFVFCLLCILWFLQTRAMSCIWQRQDPVETMTVMMTVIANEMCFSLCKTIFKFLNSRVGSIYSWFFGLTAFRKCLSLCHCSSLIWVYIKRE